MQDKIDILVLNWNYERYLSQFVGGLANQTYQHFRVLFYDNCSTDNSIQTAKRLMEDASLNFKIITRSEPHTIPSNLKYLIDNFVTAEWMITISSDDWLLPDMVQNRIKYIHGHPAAEFIFTTPVLYYENENRYENQPSQKGKLSGNIFNELLNGNFLSAPGSFIKKNSLIEAGGYDETLAYEDWDMWLRAAKVKKKIDIIDDYQVVYRRHSKSISFQQDMKSYLHVKQTLSKYQSEKATGKTLDRYRFAALYYAANRKSALTISERAGYFKKLFTFHIDYFRLFLKFAWNIATSKYN